jgi:putative nucleotidyltransferase with HDIG domain
VTVADILLLAENRERAGGIQSLLREDGHTVHWQPTISGWREAERKALPEVVVAPVGTPDPVLAVQGRPPRGFPAPLLFVHDDSDFFPEVRLDERIVDRIGSPFGAEELLARVDALVKVRRVVLWGGSGKPDRSLGTGNRPAEGRAIWRAVGSRIGAVLSSRVPRYERPAEPYLEVASRAAEWADGRDAFEPGHAERVASFSAMMADEMRLDDGEAAALLRAAMLHDIGKVALPADILRQRGPLDEEQTRLMRTHAERGAALLRILDRDEEVACVIQYHHERADGKGYYGKAGSEVPRLSRVLAVAEAFDAMTTSRVRATLTVARARAFLAEQRGVQFDAESVDALLQATRPVGASVAISRS